MHGTANFIAENHTAPLLEVGTRVEYTHPGFGSRWTGVVHRAYRIRFGHRMYDVETGGMVSTYHGHHQLTVLPS